MAVLTSRHWKGTLMVSATAPEKSREGRKCMLGQVPNTTHSQGSKCPLNLSTTLQTLHMGWRVTQTWTLIFLSLSPSLLSFLLSPQHPASHLAGTKGQA